MFGSRRPIAQILAGIAVLSVGIVVHKGWSQYVLDAVGTLVLVIGGARWLRQRRGGRAGQ
jgi:threonine/homoserine efflux transporter RhtA